MGRSGKPQTLTQLYLTYPWQASEPASCTGRPSQRLKWFPDHRGLAAGLTRGGLRRRVGAPVAPIANLIQSAGYRTAFINWGLVQGAVVVIGRCSGSGPRRAGCQYLEDLAEGRDGEATAQTAVRVHLMADGLEPQFW